MVLLNVSNTHLFMQGEAPRPIDELHQPVFLAFPQDKTESIDHAFDRLRDLAAGAGDATDEDDLAKILEVREPLTYKSFWNHGKTREVIPVASRRSYWVPDISDRLFFDHGFFTAEHDIPYIERAVADLSAEQDMWLFETGAKPGRLDVLTYDIETTQYGDGATEVPIDMVGYADFPVTYEARKDLDEEKFHFQFNDLPDDWKEREIIQIVARNRDEELDLLENFTRHAVTKDMVSGHNVLGFDNKQIHDRIVDALKRNQRDQSLSPSQEAWFREFTGTYSRKDRSFHFGTSQDIAVWHPSTLDTYHAARKFYFFHDDFTLKGLAPWLGIDVADRVYLQPHEMKLDQATLKYNEHDVREQLGVTQVLLAQALPLAFTVNLPLESLLTGGNTKMWDHMAFIRARRERRMMPATCRAQSIARSIQRYLPDTPFPERRGVAAAARTIPPEQRGQQYDKEFIRVAKQGPEMPFWCEHPGVIVDPAAAGSAGSDGHGYAIPGGMTLKPDSDLKSHFVPWYHVVAADVGAMYPTILKARNLTADTVAPARRDKGEEPDEWLWLFELAQGFRDSDRYFVRRPDEKTESYAKGRGWMIGVKHSGEDGMVNKAMTGILDTIQKVKDARAAAKRDGASERDVRIHDMTYASLKAARNAGTHGILVAVNVSCRQFNVWGGANITTIGQRILHETLTDFEAKGIRVVYGDTDGIYIGCSKSPGNLLHFASALKSEAEPEADKWITLPDDALAAVAEANEKWRDLLDYEGFELEPELHDAMVFVVHKNYLIFDAKDDQVVMQTKGNNFRGSDKAPLAQRLLLPIMTQSLLEVGAWSDEEDARNRMQTAIKRATKEVMATVKVTETPWDDLILRQAVQPMRRYKTNPDGTLSGFAVRTVAVEQVIGEPVNATRKFRFVVCKDPLPLYQNPQAQQAAKEQLARHGHQLVVKKPKKSGIKPIEYMWPMEKVTPNMVDWQWYRDMVENYVKGAFGFDSLELAVQRDLSSWF